MTTELTNKNKLFQYYLNVIENSDKEKNTYLNNQLKKIKDIPKTSVLALFLNKKTKPENIPPSDALIFPFGCNQSQMKAVENALNNQVSLIEGPPGTGKTQTILNIIANILLEGKNVAIVSHTNDATNNVFEKLGKYGFSYVAAELGNSENKKEFFSNKQLPYPDFTQDNISPSQFLRLKTRVTRLKAEMVQMLEKQNRIAILEQELVALKTEQTYFNNYFSLNYEEKQIFRNLSKQSSKNIQRLWVLVQARLDSEIKISFWFKLKTILLYGIKNFSVYRDLETTIVPYLQTSFYEQKLKEIRQELLYSKAFLGNYNFNDKMSELLDNSIQILKATLARKYSKKTRTYFEETILREDPHCFIAEYPVVLCTTHTARNNFGDFCYDYVIVDEASQVSLIPGLLAMSCAKRMVIVGDLKQLPNIISKDVAKEIAPISAWYTIDNPYRVEKNSLLSSACTIFSAFPKVLLREHYRCHPKIIDFCNKKFYNNELIIMTKDEGELDVLMVYMTTPGNHARGRINQRQIDEIKHNVLSELESNDLGIIAPYNDQSTKLKKDLQDRYEISTVHKFQGREKNDIIISTVDNIITEFTANANMLNVAVSRAKNKLRLIVSNHEDNEATNIGDLIKYIEYNNFTVKSSDINSVFDLLYASYEMERKKHLKDRKKISEYDSENLMNTIIEKILGMAKFSHLSVRVHVALNTLIQDLTKLSEPECRYVRHPATHVDFLIFNSMDKSPSLVIEVDGHKYHQPGTKQSERDQMKDYILEKYSIPLIRFPTTGSGEREKLIEKLETLSLARTGEDTLYSKP